MTVPPMTKVNTRGLFEDLRGLLQERFRRVFLRRDRKANPTRPSEAIEAATRHFLFELPETRRGIQKIVSEHVTKGRKTRLQTHTVYAPELLKELIRDIGREAWTRRYDGPLEIELKVRTSQVSLYQIRHPDAPICAPP
jgi:hypothetical protein